MSQNLKLKFFAYTLANRVLSRRARHAIGRTSLLKPLRDRFFRPQGAPEVLGDHIEYECLKFYFSAPYPVMAKAKHGIENMICRLIMSQRTEDYVCIDVGASYGFLTMIMALSAEPKGRVLSFEPVPYIESILDETLRANDLSGICKLYQRAVSNVHDDAVYLPYYGNYGEMVEVPTVTLDRIVAEEKLEHVDIIKIDVDGPELEILLGAKEVIDRFHPVLIVETIANQEEIFKLLTAMGYTYILDMYCQPVTPGNWPLNTIASMRPIEVPTRNAWKDMEHLPSLHKRSNISPSCESPT